MGKAQTKSLDKPDETRSFPNGTSEIVEIGSTLIGRAIMQPGWRWSKDVKPIAGSERCMVLHKGYCISGSLMVQADDGTEVQIGPGDAYVIEPGHDGWVIGDEPYVAIDFSEQMKGYAKPPA
jgi:hypothetical protein